RGCALPGLGSGLLAPAALGRGGDRGCEPARRREKRGPETGKGRQGGRNAGILPRKDPCPVTVGDRGGGVRPPGGATRRYTSSGPPSRCAGRPACSVPVIRPGGHDPLTPARRDWPPSFGAALSGSAGRNDERPLGPLPPSPPA